MSEDCLTLNVIRPSGYDDISLPVLLWIYGGGLYWGSSADLQYNMSGIVKTAAEAGLPFIGVSINYRLGIWGFLATPEIQAEGSSNAGLLDQRLAMRWVQENIGAFGGDPARVTLWGESAGAQSIAFHLYSYDGRDDSLYSGTILESGSTVGCQLNALPFYIAPYENLTRIVGCWTSTNKLACLRNLTSTELFHSNYSLTWNPIVDGTFLTGYPASQLAPAQKFIKIPLLLGTNTDESINFSPRGIDTETDLFNALLSWRNYNLSPPTIRNLLALYPSDPASQSPTNIPPNITYPAYGTQWRRAASIGGDLVMHSGRRKMCRDYTQAGISNIFSYKFDTPLWNASVSTPPAGVGVKQFDNVVFSFQNISGGLGPMPQFEHYKVLGEEIGRAYAKFVWDRDPNLGKGKGLVWPKYEVAGPRNLVLRAGKGKSFVEEDDWREEGMEYMFGIARELLA